MNRRQNLPSSLQMKCSLRSWCSKSGISSCLCLFWKQMLKDFLFIIWASGDWTQGLTCACQSYTWVLWTCFVKKKNISLFSRPTRLIVKKDVVTHLLSVSVMWRPGCFKVILSYMCCRTARATVDFNNKKKGYNVNFFYNVRPWFTYS